MMAKLVYGLQQSLDGCVDHTKLGPPGPVVYRHFLEHVRGVAGMIYGRRMYEIMRYWDDDQPGWDEVEHEFAAAWRSKQKWVVSRTLQSVGPNAALLTCNVEHAIRKLKSEHLGEIDVAGPDLAQSLATTGLIDEYRLYFRPVVLGEPGAPFFAGRVPALRFAGSEQIGDDVVRLTYFPLDAAL